MSESKRNVRPNLSLESTQLDWVVKFLTVAELRGFRAAARHLGITPSAVSQAIRNLESRIGVTLFARNTKSVGLTEAGARLFADVHPAVEMLAAGLSAASGLGKEITGTLRINSPRAALPLVANRLLPGFLAVHPKLQLDLVGEDRNIDIVKEGFDAGIRFSHLVEPTMESTPLTPPDRFVVVGTASFLRINGCPRVPEDLYHFPCIGYRRPSLKVEPWSFVVSGQQVNIEVEGRLTTNDVETCIRAVLRGVGLFRFPRSLVMYYLHTGQMETALDEYSVGIQGLSLYYPSKNRSLPKLRAFIDYAEKNMAREFASDDFLPTASTEVLQQRQANPSRRGQRRAR